MELDLRYIRAREEIDGMKTWTSRSRSRGPPR
jgi:hypothetical protein